MNTRDLWKVLCLLLGLWMSGMTVPANGQPNLVGTYKGIATVISSSSQNWWNNDWQVQVQIEKQQGIGFIGKLVLIPPSLPPTPQSLPLSGVIYSELHFTVPGRIFDAWLVTTNRGQELVGYWLATSGYEAATFALVKQ